MTLHFAGRVQDRDGSGRELIQYSYISLKSDFFEWLKVHGRLPSSTIDEYFQEVQTLNRLKKENKEKDEELLKVSKREKDAQEQIDELIQKTLQLEFQLKVISNEKNQIEAKLNASKK